MSASPSPDAAGMPTLSHMSEPSRDPSIQDIDQISLLISLHELVRGTDPDSPKNVIQNLRNHFSGHPEDVWALALRLKLEAGEHTTAELGELFGVARSTVYRTVKRAQASTGS